jgi:hypothetical protein
MSSAIAFVASFVSILIGTAVGMILKRSLPPELLEGASREAIRLGAGFLATIAALVIGRMIASAKNSYDTQSANIRQLGTNAVLVDPRETCCARQSRRRRIGSGRNGRDHCPDLPRQHLRAPWLRTRASEVAAGRRLDVPLFPS